MAAAKRSKLPQALLIVCEGKTEEAYFRFAGLPVRTGRKNSAIKQMFVLCLTNSRCSATIGYSKKVRRCEHELSF